MDVPGHKAERRVHAGAVGVEGGSCRQRGN